jgi:hypothetical protein
VHDTTRFKEAASGGLTSVVAHEGMAPAALLLGASKSDSGWLFWQRHDSVGSSIWRSWLESDEERPDLASGVSDPAAVAWIQQAVATVRGVPHGWSLDGFFFFLF